MYTALFVLGIVMFGYLMYVLIRPKSFNGNGFLSGEMNTEILGVALQIVLLMVISYPLGKHIAKVYKGWKRLHGGFHEAG